ncbi:MAG: hypothetical protein NT141_00290 [candidate division WWE3 bacterium]|nr:hypothetical protein [candidate division WWE3 bacterium]
MKAKIGSKQNPSEYLKAVIPHIEVLTDPRAGRAKLLSPREFGILANRVRKTFKNESSVYPDISNKS